MLDRSGICAAPFRFARHRPAFVGALEASHARSDFAPMAQLIAKGVLHTLAGTKSDVTEIE